MKIRTITVWAEEIPLKFAFKHALAERRHSDSLIVKAVLDNGACGWGEALPRQYVTGETVGGCIEALGTRILPRLAGLEITTADDLRAAILDLHDDPLTGGDLAALCSIELALLDALARSEGKTMYALLDRKPRVRTVTYSMVLGSGEKKARKLARLSRLLGIAEIKVKVGPSPIDNERLVFAVRSVYPHARLRLDANCAWTLDSARHNLDVLRRYGIEACEQPLDRHDINGHARLVAEYPALRICADESLCSYNDARKLAVARAVNCFNIRLSKNGGLFNALRIHALAQKAGIACQLGAQVGETSILSAAGRIFAGISGDLCYHEGSFGTRLIASDVVRRPVVFGLGGRAVTRCRGQGWGIPADEAQVERFAVDRVSFPPVGSHAVLMRSESMPQSSPPSLALGGMA
ncbi:MAG: hypothetical protein IPK66_04895 [Rhodospirillales bacterium]|nr:hypothetical protein [Rhodospirillales bacterium]